MDHSDNPGLPDAADHLVATEAGKKLCHPGRRAMFLETQLRMGVKVSSPFSDFVMQFGKAVSCWHWRFLFRSVSPNYGDPSP
ncbi:MAG: hypothetical protein FalmKO_32310 [Falsiruegeria mediterranea]